MRLGPLIMAGVAALAAVGGVGLLAPSVRGHARSAPNAQARRIGGVMLLTVALILSLFATTLDGMA